MVLEGFFNLILGWVKYLGNPWNVITISFIVTFLITLAYKFLTNQAEMKELKEKMKEYQKQMKENRDNMEVFQQVQKDMMKLQGKYFKHSMRPMLFTFLPLILIFGWMRNTFNTGADIFSWGFKLPLFGTGFGWLGTYIFSSIIFSMIIRKFMKVN